MSKVSEFHKLYHAQHDKIAMTHATMMGHHEPGSAEHTHHKVKHEAHVAMRDFHKACMEKASTADDLQKADLQAVVDAAVAKVLNRVVPTDISAVTPTHPSFGIKAITRAGQRPLPTETPAPPLEFQKLFSAEDGPDGALRQ